MIWRDTANWKVKDYERDRAFVAESGMAKGAVYVYVNDKSMIKGAVSLTPEFAARMFPPAAAE